MYVKIDEEGVCNAALDRWDTWNLDVTLAKIILPCLKQLKETNHGVPDVEDSDVPHELRESRDLWFMRWDWVLGEMIWTFDFIAYHNYDDPEESIQDRIDNGLRLFGKYYRDLWDY
jgi:hypothetical protein